MKNRNFTILTFVIFLVSVFILPLGASSHSDEKTASEKDPQSIATEYRTHRDNYLKAKSAFETARTEIKKDPTSKAKAQYVDALISFLVARLDSLNFFVQVQSVLSETDHSTLESGINTEKAWLETQRNIKDVVSTGKALRDHIDMYDVLTKNVVGALAAARQQNLINESNKFVEKLKTHVIYIEGTGASTDTLNTYLAEYTTSSQKASAQLSKANVGFISLSGSSTYAAALENLLDGNTEVRKSSNILLFLYDAIQNMTSSLGGNSSKANPPASNNLNTEKSPVVESPNPPAQI